MLFVSETVIEKGEIRCEKQSGFGYMENLKFIIICSCIAGGYSRIMTFLLCSGLQDPN